VNEHTPARVLTLPPKQDNPRNSEGDFVQLNSGRWLFVYTYFDGGDGDHASAHLAARITDDDGATWSQEDHVVLPNEAGMNVMSVSLQRLTDGRIALLYLRKESVTDCRPYLRYSEDEAQTWSQPVKVIPDEDAAYYVVNNDRLIQLETGRLVIPAALHEVQHDPPAFSPYGRALCYVSDDGGRTWQRGCEARVRPRADGVPVMVQEPGVVELRDGRLMGPSLAHRRSSRRSHPRRSNASPRPATSCLSGMTMPASRAIWRASARPSPWHCRRMKV